MSTTTQDWLRRAEAAVDQAERRGCVVEAQAIAADGNDWHEIAEAWCAVPDHAAAAEALARALRHAPEQGWVYRGVAELQRYELDDVAACRQTLATQRADLAGRGCRSGFEWVALAEAYVELLDDLGAASAALAEGEARAESVTDLCALATARKDLFDDGDAARGLLDRAEAQAEREAADAADMHAWWGLASACDDALADAGWGDRCLRRGLEHAETVAACVTIATAWSVREIAEAARRAGIEAGLDRARSRAAGCADWLAVAEAEHELLADRDAVRRSLRRAAELVPTAAQRGRLAFAYRRWLDAPEEAAAFGPPGVLPASRGSTDARLEGIAADPAALFDRLRARVGDATLDAIAQADPLDAEAHRAALEEIRDSGAVPDPLEWNPREAVALTRWDDGVDVDHTRRAFCCVLLCLDALGEEGGEDGLECTLAILLESARALGLDELRGVRGLLVALHERITDLTERAFVRLALLLVVAWLDPRDPALEPLAAGLDALEAEGARHGYCSPEHGWLLGLTFFDQRHATWRQLIDDALRETGGGVALAALRARLRG